MHNGMLDVAHNCDASELAAKSATFPVKVGTGKTVYAIANMTAGSAARVAADGCSTLAGLEAVAFDLSLNTSSNFVMWAKKTNLTVAAAGSDAGTLSLSRYAAKIALRKVTNSLPAPYGAITLKHAFLCNVVGNQNVAGSASLSTWYNQEGTKAHANASNVIAAAADAACSDLTFRTLGESVANGANRSYSTTDGNGKYFYGFRNTVTTLPSGFHSTFVQTCTVLMLVATVGGVDYYYPIPLGNALAANSDNVVDVTLTGLGNTVAEGVFNKIEKGNLKATVSVSDWTNGSTYTETL